MGWMGFAPAVMGRLVAGCRHRPAVYPDAMLLLVGNVGEGYCPLAVVASPAVRAGS